MALINTLRNKAGKIVVVAITVSMLAFILTDLFQGNSVLFGGQSNDIGDIAGETISYEKFQSKLDQLSYTFALNTGRSPLSEDLEILRQEAWQALIVENAFEPQFNELGIMVSNMEVVDMVQGNNIHPQIQQFFTDPNTGIFNKDQVIGFLQSLNSAPPQQRQSWISFEASLRPSRVFSKYENMLELSKYANKYEGQDFYIASNSTATVDYLYVPYFSLADSLFTVDEDELEDYLSDHADEYQRDGTKGLSYVTFEIKPSAADSLFVLEEIQSLKEGFASAQNDSTYALINSEGLEPFKIFRSDDLPDELRTDNGVASIGTITNATLEGSSYIFYKLVDVQAGDEYFVRASHILFKAVDDSPSAKNQARGEARRVLREIRGGANFEEMASIYGTDGTASTGGDLGWFGENGSFVQEFKDAAFGFNRAGLLPDVVETEFGYHILKITEPETNTIYKVATIEKELFESDQTINEIYRQADLFAASCQSISEFNAKANELKLTVKKASRIGKNDKRVGNIQEARSVIYWLFNKASLGTVSEVFELSDQYLIAVQTEEQEEGTASLNDVRNEISKKVIDQKKADYLIEQLSQYDGSLEEIQTSYGEGARVANADITLNSNSFGGAGYAPEAVGVTFSLEDGERTRPFKINNGVLIVELSSKTMAEPREDYSSFQNSVITQYRSFRRREEPRTIQNIYDAIIEYADIKDDRYRFY